MAQRTSPLTAQPELWTTDYSAWAAVFRSRNVATPLAQFQDDGNVLLLECGQNGIHQGQTGLSNDPNDEEFIIQDSASILLKITSDGELHIKGNIDD